MDRKELIHVLECCELFKGLPQGDVDKIASLCQAKTYEAGEYVARQGDFGEHLYFIADGQVVLERLTDLGTRKGTVPIGLLGKGRAFGCWSTLLGEPHSLMSSAVCRKPTKVLAIKGTALREMLLNNVATGFNVLERLCFLLRDRIQHAYGAMEKI